MKVKVSSVRSNWPYFYPRDEFTVIRSEEHRSLLETDTGARQWVGNSFLTTLDGRPYATPSPSPKGEEPVAWLSRCEMGEYAGEMEAELRKPDRRPFNPDWSEWFPVYAHPVPLPVTISDELDATDFQALARLKRDNVWDGARPVLERRDDEMERAFSLSDRGLIALEQVAQGVRLHITRKGVAALESALAVHREGE